MRKEEEGIRVEKEEPDFFDEMVGHFARLTYGFVEALGIEDNYCHTINIISYRNEDKLTSEDKKAKEIFLKHAHEFPLDVGSLDKRYEAAEEFQEKYFQGTPYTVTVEEHCCNCSTTTLIRKESFLD